MKEFRRLDLNAEEMGVPVSQLMERAGRALAEAAMQLAPTGTIVFLCGKGNNGGDGYAAIPALLAEGRLVRCVVVESPVGPESRRAFAGVDAGICSTWDGFQGSPPEEIGLVVDCLLGSGIRGAPRGPYRAAIEWANGQEAPVLACDVPSGLGTGFAIRPVRTCTFHALKEGMDASSCGQIDVVDIGIPPDAETHVGRGDLVVAYPRPDSASHKGDNGRLLVVGGGPFTGAPFYAAMGAYRTGADLVRLAAPRDAAAIIATWGPEVLVEGVGSGREFEPADAASIAVALDHVRAVVIGPGLGTAPGALEMVQLLVPMAAERGLPMVIDADGLRALDDELLKLHGDRMVLTPHGQEFARLTGDDAAAGAGGVEHREAVASFARRHGVTVIRKGTIDVIASPHRVKHCKRGHPTMTVGGTGDVLAGCIGALLAKGAAPFDAACAGAYLVGVAGETAAAWRSYGATATDVYEAIPAALQRLDE